jgi:TRAP-type C4-dicarboxylate transport system permease small subunit
MSAEEKDPPKEPAADPVEEEAPAPEAESKPSSPWPSARKSIPPKDAAVSAAPPAVATAADTAGKAAWGAPIDRLDRAWTKLDARLCAFVLIADAMTLVAWISLKALSHTGTGGSGRVFRCLVAALIFGGVTHLLTRKRTDKHEAITTGAVVAGFLVGSQLGDFGVEYFGNLLAWMQNASILVFFGGASDIAKRLTLWLALLGASVATGQGKHINVDVVMRFLSPRARVPVAVLGWMVAAVVCFVAVWGFFDHVAVVDYGAKVNVPCANDPEKSCTASPGSKVDTVLKDTGRDMFLAGRQLSMDLKTLPKVLSGTPYGKWLTPKEWNEWLHDGGWEKHFPAADIKAMEMEDTPDTFRTPAVTAIPGAGERVYQLLVRECNFVFAFGLLVISIRFIIRSLLAIAGWVKVDPNAAHGDEDLAQTHDASAQALAVDDAMKEGSR